MNVEVLARLLYIQVKWAFAESSLRASFSYLGDTAGFSQYK